MKIKMVNPNVDFNYEENRIKELKAMIKKREVEIEVFKKEIRSMFDPIEMIL